MFDLFHNLVNKCRPNPCQNAARCVIDLKRMDGYRCVCTSDFTGRHCQGGRVYMMAYGYHGVNATQTFSAAHSK